MMGGLYQHKLRHQNDGGFTIVEVLIVMAVTGVLFASAVLLINGKQRVTAFNQSIRNIQTELQQVANDVNSGYYTNDGNITCKKNGGGSLKLSSGAANLGTNQDCIFLGKVVRFGIPSTDPEQYDVYTIAGLRGDESSQTVDLASAQARVIARGTTDPVTVPASAYDAKKLQYGLTISKMYYGAGTAIGAFGFTSSLHAITDSDTSQQVNVVAIPGVTLGGSRGGVIDQINAGLAGSVINPPSGVKICFNSGGTTQSGLISVGGDNRQALVSLQIFSTLDCV